MILPSNSIATGTEEGVAGPGPTQATQGWRPSEGHMTVRNSSANILSCTITSCLLMLCDSRKSLITNFARLSNAFGRSLIFLQCMWLLVQVFFLFCYSHCSSPRALTLVCFVSHYRDSLSSECARASSRMFGWAKARLLFVNQQSFSSSSVES